MPELLLASGPDFPSVSELLPNAPLFHGTVFAINSIILIRLVATALILLIMCVAAARAKVVPGRFQSAVEWVIDFLRSSIVYEFLGEAQGERYTNLIVTLFVSIFLFNFCENIPGANVAADTTIAMPLILAIWSLINYWAAGIRTKGLWKFLKDELLPKGVPWPIYILLVPINLLEIIIIRPFSLTIRLFINMVAGYLLVGLCFAATQWFFFSTGWDLKWIGVFSLLGGFVMTCFEMMVDAIQAYIFSVLTAAYIMLSIPDSSQVGAGDPVKVAKLQAKIGPNKAKSLSKVKG